MSISKPAVLATAALLLGLDAAQAMAPLPRPDVSASILAGQSAPFAGSWAVTLPTREVTEPSETLATCDRPIRIEPANETHIFYLGPDEDEADAATELITYGDGTRWEPIAGGPAFISLWVTQNQFYLYDAVAEGDPDWSAPYIYDRCI
jgi:hypothetical protein